jgi:mono/diheme cytochrome c family protein
MRAGICILLALTLCRAAVAADAPAPLKPGKGAEAASEYCNTCHTSDYIVMNSMFLSAAAWQAEVTKMRSAFGARMDDNVAAGIAAYLADNYAAAGTP